MHIEIGPKRLYSVNWVTFFFALEQWKSLPPSARRKMAEGLDNTGYISTNAFGDEYKAIAQTGLVEISSKGICAKKQFWPFFLLIKDMEELHQHTKSQFFFQYVAKYFKDNQLGSRANFYRGLRGCVKSS